MHDSSTDRVPDPAPGRRYETTDVTPYYIGVLALGMVLLVVMVLPLLGWVFWRFEASAKWADPLLSPLAGRQDVPPSGTGRIPQLQEKPAADLLRLRRDEDQILSSYGWIDPEQKVVRIPIDQAIRILAERGLPAPQGPVQPPKAEERVR